MTRLALTKPLCLLLVFGLIVGNNAMAGTGAEILSSDVSVNQGVVIGSVINASARPVSGIRVRLAHQNTVIATAVSDENGQFIVKNLRSGNHTLQIGATQHRVRFWSEQSAPPSASSQMVIVVNEELVRGQGCAEECTAGSSVLSSMTSNPVPLLLIGGAVAATIAISNSHDDASP